MSVDGVVRWEVVWRWEGVGRVLGSWVWSRSGNRCLVRGASEVVGRIANVRYSPGLEEEFRMDAGMAVGSFAVAGYGLAVALWNRMVADIVFGIVWLLHLVPDIFGMADCMYRIVERRRSCCSSGSL